MKTFLMLIIVSLMLGPLAAPAQAVAADQAHHQTVAADEHDCCDEQGTMTVAQMQHQDCEPNCTDCQHHCSSFASGLMTVRLLDSNLAGQAQWPAEITSPLNRIERQDRPPLPVIS
ncbi:hypothetical protein IDSA_00535 [Pseudidiomarina salinarum]|uniref:Uncharacterized protein n=1 Tax=Pseudidiomarina salinarum TaxID=435908 RepID=A0A094L8V6_9GAMM|nr:hypothetical protein [Pseudidiomarina salinarum]KFZ31258.1 hypothetical protein IDSA_00535 [Pseudidiomarina salinarum]RUO70993.1 hypothetical protein CWI79_06020 [Pseudidiomarina salinarum]